MLRTLLKALTGKHATRPATTTSNISTLVDATKTPDPGEGEPESAKQVALNTSWIEHAYPLKQLVIEILASGQTASIDAIRCLEVVHHELANGQNSGEATAPTLEYVFTYQDKVPFLSFFHDYVGQRSPQNLHSNLIEAEGVYLTVKLQGIRHTERSEVVRLIPSVIDQLKTGACSGRHHDDDYGYLYELSRTRAIN